MGEVYDRYIDTAGNLHYTDVDTGHHLIRMQDTIDAIMGQPPEPHYPSWYAEQIKKLPPAQSAGEIVLDKETILEAGYQGREVEFRIGGRLFAIREKAQ